MPRFTLIFMLFAFCIIYNIWYFNNGNPTFFNLKIELVVDEQQKYLDIDIDV